MYNQSAGSRSGGMGCHITLKGWYGLSHCCKGVVWVVHCCKGAYGLSHCCEVVVWVVTLLSFLKSLF